MQPIFLPQGTQCTWPNQIRRIIIIQEFFFKKKPLGYYFGEKILQNFQHQMSAQSNQQNVFSLYQKLWASGSEEFHNTGTSAEN